MLRSRVNSPPRGRPLAFVVLVSALSLTSCETDNLLDPAPADDSGGSIETVAAQFVDAREEFLDNGDVESGDGTPEGWWTGGMEYDRYDFEWSEEAATSGTRSLRVSRSDAGANGFGFWAQTVTVGNLAGTRLTLSLPVKLDRVTGQGVAVAIR